LSGCCGHADLAEFSSQLRKYHHRASSQTAKQMAATIASTSQIRNRIWTLNQSTRVTPRRLNETRQSVLIMEPLDSSDILLTPAHDALLVAGESGTG
jgi:hypothetical protein